MIKNIYKVMLLVAVVLATACQDDELIQQNNNPAAIGDEIVFGARAGFENSNADSRTVYTGEFYTNDAGTKFERIDWVDGTDMIEIYSEGASNGPTAHYTINHWKDHDTQKDYAYLTRVGNSSLQWGEGVDEAGTHNFYAMYPSSQMFTTDQSTLAQGIKMDGKTLIGVIPASQSPISITPTDGNYVAAPDMKYAYMAAKTSATRFDAKNNQNGISLTFVPVVTAVQIQLIVPEKVSSGTGNVIPVSIGEIQVQGTGIAGNFTADLNDWTGTYPKCANVGEGGNSIQISTWIDNKPITLTAGKSLTFTVFLRPGVNVSDLKVRVSPTGAGYVGKSLTDVTIPQNLKTVITNLKLPATGVEIDASKWMSQLSDTTRLKKLSIPGTGGSFTYGYTKSDSSSYKQQYQHMDLEAQWKLGIRAFEISSDRCSETPGTVDAATSLGSLNVTCNGTPVGVKVGDVLNNLLTKVSTFVDENNNPTETAVLILTYQPEGGWGGMSDDGNRNATYYARNLRKMYNGLSEAQKKQIIQYRPDIKLSEAKANVMIFCRINQKDESDNGSFADAASALEGTNITLIDGCGTGKDRWGSRGYKVQGNVAYDAGNVNDATKSVDYYLSKSNNGSFADWANVKVPNAANGELNFKFKTNYSGIECWYQEWARVVPASLIDSNLGYYFADISPSIINWNPTDYRWYESYNEKLAAVEETFKMAISDKYTTYIFINSLCGYFVDAGISSSYTVFTGANTGGIAGNIKALANALNPAFYQYVLESGMEQTTGPTGIVMMDYVSSNPNDGGSYYLPGVIIANNFKFGSGNAGNIGGGNNNNNGNGNTDTDKPGSGTGSGDGF